MKQLVAAFAAAVLSAGLVAVPTSTAQSDATTSEVRAIVDKALERAEWAEEQAFAARFRHAMSQRTRRYDGDGEVTDDETRTYDVEPHRGVLYAKLITKNGEPITGNDLETEERRWEEFLEALDDPPDEDDEDEDDDNEIVFDEELLDRYTAVLDGIRVLRGRPSYVLSFQPRPGKLPVRRRLDHALNKSRGEIWIDQETYEISRVSFEMMERVRLWWGILGSVSDAKGHIERQPIGEDAWMPTELDIYFHVRVLFSTTRRGETTHWNDFEPVAD
ncbi:MAG: hypothetical protein QF681_10495 [Vicinamibacterales bacterium]|jgi:hypothetical protein|nr:hypothetical protein [Vicinamibacterales bacterium]